MYEPIKDNEMYEKIRDNEMYEPIKDTEMYETIRDNAIHLPIVQLTFALLQSPLMINEIFY